MPIINCSDCGHLKAFHHAATGNCSKESRSGCHFSVEIDKEKFLECECYKTF
jgi:hypothetical protein